MDSVARFSHLVLFWKIMLRIEKIDTRDMVCGIGSGGMYVWDYKVSPFDICPDINIPYADILSLPYAKSMDYTRKYLNKHRFTLFSEYIIIEIHLDSCEIGNEVIV